MKKIEDLVEKARCFPSLAHMYILELDRQLRAMGKGTITFSALDISKHCMVTARELGIDKLFSTKENSKGTNVIYEAESLVKEGKCSEAFSYAFSHAQGLQVNSLNILYANHATQQSEMRRYFLNKYLSAYGLRIDLERDGNTNFFQRLHYGRVFEKVNGPLVSVIMPSHNAEATIELAINSLLLQSWHNLQIIVVDDASTDSTLQKANALAKSDPRVEVISNSVNVGPYVSRNMGALHVQGKWLTVHDADDWAFPDRIAQQVKKLTDTQSEFCTGGMLRMNAKGQITRPSPAEVNNEDGYQRLCYVSLMVQTDIFRKVLGAWDSVWVGGDAEMIARLNSLGFKSTHLERPLMLCLDHPAGLTNHPELGLLAEDGRISKVRFDYQHAYEKWHQLEGPKKLSPFGASKGADLPESNRVPLADIRKLLENNDKKAELDLSINSALKLDSSGFAELAVIDEYKGRVDFSADTVNMPSRFGKKVAGIASIPSREVGLSQAMRSLENQIDEFHVYLNGYTGIPSWLATWPGVTIYTSQQFGVLGDSGKFFGFDRTEARWYFTCDDDIVYPPDYTFVLIDASVRYKSPVGVHGSLLKYPVRGYYEPKVRHVLHFKWKNKVDRRVPILGTGTMLLDRRLISCLPRFDFPNMADIWIAKLMAQMKMPMYAVARGDSWLKEADVPAQSIYAENMNERTDQRIIVEKEVRSIGELALPIKGANIKVMVAIKTFNRVDYLKKCVESLCRTVCDEIYDVVVVVADDGSSDGTHEYLSGLSIPFEFHLIRNQRTFVSGQFNSILRLGKSLDVDFYFIADDDLFFKKPGWMHGYIDAIRKSKFDHLCHFNLPHFKQICERTKDTFPPVRHTHKKYPLESYVGVQRAMGALFTLTPAVIQKVGFADEVNFFVRGGWHGDYSARCCRAGFNEQERFWDLHDSNDYLELQNTRQENYRSAIDWESEDFKRASTAEERKRRELVKGMPHRIFVDADTAIHGPLISVQDAKFSPLATVNDVFQKVYVINLDRRQDRMAAMHSRLTNWDIAYERFPAVDGSDLEVKKQYSRYCDSRPGFDANSHLFTNEFYFGGKTDAQRTAHIESCIKGPAIRSSGAMAYLLTYRNILRRCIEEGTERVLVLDDDCLFHNEFGRIFNDAYAELPASWRIFQLGTMQYNWNLTEKYSSKLYLPRGVLVASHAVGLHAETFPSLLEGITRMTLPFDIGPLQDTSRIFSESSFICLPNIIIQDQSESDINSSEVAKNEVSKKSNIYGWNLCDYK
jgi:glycosyltransferase involved in cell wall biosynthesis/GR25 family glycosyltransferase involved in LPS biosynthesis